VTHKISILFIVNTLEVGGAEKHVLSLLRGLDRERFHLSLVYLKDKGQLHAEFATAAIDGEFQCAGVSRKSDLAAMCRAVALIRATLARQSVDIVVCTNLFALLYGSLACAFLPANERPRLVEAFHTTEMRSIKHKLLMLLYRPLIAACDSVVFVCETQRRYWKERGLAPRGATVIHNGVDVAHFHDAGTVQERYALRRQYAFSETDYVIGICAAMRPEKAHGDLLQAIALLKQQGIAARCLMIGDGIERQHIEREIDRLGLRTDVHITGVLPDVRAAIAACDVMVLVSHAVETFSIAALEAMALGKPMVMSAVGGAAEQIQQGENGFLYPRGDIAALAAALAGLVDATRRTAMSLAARRNVVERFSLPVMIARYEHLFAELAASSARAYRAGGRPVSRLG
jgi:glycosyltransferase involved in cell wall biosynthesis